MDQIPEAAWLAPVTSRQHASPRPFAEEIGAETRAEATLLIFLRHLG
tara:strand:- start:419 stop:559 length:141 start_codon:yes stop_codon:yes gene_type:complete